MESSMISHQKKLLFIRVLEEMREEVSMIFYLYVVL